MILKHFTVGIFIRLLLMGIVMFLLIKFWYINENTLSIFVLLTALVYLFFELIRYVNVTNKKVSKFLDSVKYADFVSGYTADNDKGATYRELNRSLHEVMNVFRKTRLEKKNICFLLQ